MDAQNLISIAREDRAFYNAAGDPHLFPTDLFVGRITEVQNLRNAIDGTSSRFVTVVGTAGVGKTRLALEALRSADKYYPGGAVVVRLAAVDQVTGIIPEIARACGIVDQAEKLDTLVYEALAAEPTILFLDCLEHLIPAVDDLVNTLLNTCPELRIVSTSRRPLGLPGEVLLELAPLSLAKSDDPGALLQSDAVQLFVDRARKAREWFSLQDGDAKLVHELCARYDGLPLAIELMASWMTVFSLKELLQWYPEELEFRTPLKDPRHQGLFDAIAWSFGLLSPAARTLLARLSIFTGGFSRDLVEGISRGRDAGAGYPFAEGYELQGPFFLEVDSPPIVHPQDPTVARAIEPLAGDPTQLLATLIDHRLVYQSGEIDGAPRFDMLEAIREFGQWHLEKTGQLESVRHAHAATMVAFCSAVSEGFWNKQYQQYSQERIDADLQNIRAAISWSAPKGETGAELVARMAGSLWNYWQTRGLVTEGRRYLEQSLSTPGLPVWILSKELPGLAFLCWIQGDDARCAEIVEAGLGATAITRAGSSRGMIFLVKALLEFRKGLEHAVTMMAYAEEAEHWFEMGGDKNGLGACYLIFGQVVRLTGDTHRALELFETARRMHLESGYDWGVAAGYYFSGEATRDLAENDSGYLPSAISLLHESLRRFWEMGDYWGAGGAMSGLACILTMQGEDLKAVTWFGAAKVLLDRVGGSLLPSELMTHRETEIELQTRMAGSVWQEMFDCGQQTPDLLVEQALKEMSPAAGVNGAEELPRLTRIQLSIVRDLARGYDIPRIAQRRGRSPSATYELVDRILDKLGLTDWEAIAPFAAKHGLVTSLADQSNTDPSK